MSEHKSASSGYGLIKICAAALLAVLAMPLIGLASSAQAAPAGDQKMLIVYYSWGGNTRNMAKQIQALTGADIFEIQTVQPYPADYNQTTEQAKREQDANFRPALANKIDNLADYDLIFIGSPNWWSTLAMPVFTFLDAYDLSGKTILPFMTHEGSGFGRAVDDLRKFCPNSTILDGLAVRGGRVGNAQDNISQWLTKLGLIK